MLNKQNLTQNNAKLKPEHSQFERGLAIGIQLLSNSYKQTQKKLNQFNIKVNSSSIKRWFRRFCNNGTYFPRQKGFCERKKVILKEQGDQIIQQVENNRDITALEIYNNQKNSTKRISLSTIQQFLNEKGLKARIKRKIQQLSKINLLKRIKWAEIYQKKLLSFWQNVHFTNESLMYSKISGRNFIRKNDQEDCNDERFKNQIRTDKNNLEILIWGMISFKGAEKIIWVKNALNRESYLNILRQNNIFEQFKDSEIFQQDNFKYHNSKEAVKFLKSININMLQWPPQSADLNPIENIWAIMKDELYKIKDQIKSKKELWEQAQLIFFSCKIEEAIKNSISLMPQRVNQIILNKGWRIQS